MDVRGRRSPGASPRLTTQEAMQRALELLAAEGARGLVMRRLAGALNVSLPRLYVAIGSKDDLVVELVRRATKDLLTAGVGGGRDPLQNSFETFHRALLWLELNPWFVDLIGMATSEQLATAYRTMQDEPLMSEISGLFGADPTGPQPAGWLLHGFIRSLLLAQELGAGPGNGSAQRVQLGVEVFAALAVACRQHSLAV